MKSFIIASTFGLFAALTHAVAIPAAVEARQFQAQLTFHGATPDDSYTVSVPTDGSVLQLGKSCLSEESVFWMRL